jgi:hypothetical protein
VLVALQIAHLMRRHADQHGLHLSVRELLDTLAGIEETVLIYPSTGGRPKARRLPTETTPTQDRLAEIFDLARWAPRTLLIHPTNINNAVTWQNSTMIELARKLPLARSTVSVV